MGHSRHREFAAHIHKLEQGIQSAISYGQLKFSGERVYSYDQLIAVVWVRDKIVVANDKTYSRTTTVHQGAVRGLTGYATLAVSPGQVLDTPRQIVCNKFGVSATASEEVMHDILDFYKFLSLDKKRDELTKEYASLKTPEERGSMRGLLELAKEAS